MITRPTIYPQLFQADAQSIVAWANNLVSEINRNHEAIHQDLQRLFAADEPIYPLADSATPDVDAGTVFLTSGTTAITNFSKGQTGKLIRIIAGSSVTITDGTNIFLSSSANFAMNATDTLTLIQQADGKWYEVARSDNT